jgi:hypothetical protein
MGKGEGAMVRGSDCRGGGSDCGAPRRSEQCLRAGNDMLLACTTAVSSGVLQVWFLGQQCGLWFTRCDGFYPVSFSCIQSSGPCMCCSWHLRLALQQQQPESRSFSITHYLLPA